MKFLNKIKVSIRNLTFLPIIPLMLACGISLHANDAMAQNLPAAVVFPTSDANYGCYRIPAVITLKDGSILAFAEGRVAGCNDFGNIQVVMSRSTDGGTTWSNIRVVASNGTLQAGNPVPVLDTMDPNYPQGRLFLYYNIGNKSEASVTNRHGLREQMVITSTDGGLTWSTPRNITSQTALIGVAPYNNSADWRWLAMGPGHGLQLTDGRIVIPGNYTAGAPQPGRSDGRSYTFYTADHGATYQIGGNTGYPGSNESSAAQLTTGAVMINSRNQSGLSKNRLISLSTDGALTYTYGTPDTSLIDPICEGSLLNVTWNGKPYLLFSNPNSTTSRANGHVRFSKDNGATWSSTAASFLVTAGTFAYSDMTQLNANSVGILYENGSKGIRFMNIPLSRVITAP